MKQVALFGGLFGGKVGPSIATFSLAIVTSASSEILYPDERSYLSIIRITCESITTGKNCTHDVRRES